MGPLLSWPGEVQDSLGQSSPESKENSCWGAKGQGLAGRNRAGRESGGRGLAGVLEEQKGGKGQAGPGSVFNRMDWPHHGDYR